MRAGQKSYPSLDFMESQQFSLFHRPFKLRLLETSRLLPFQWLVATASPEPRAGHYCPCHALQDLMESWPMGYQTTRLEHLSWEDMNSSVLNQATLPEKTWEMLLKLLCQDTPWGILEHQGRGNSFTQQFLQRVAEHSCSVLADYKDILFLSPLHTLVRVQQELLAIHGTPHACLHK